MENHAGPDNVHHLLMPDLERPGTTSTTLSAQEEGTAKEKERLLASSDVDTSRSSTLSKRKSCIMSDTFLLFSILLMVAWPWALFGFISTKGGIQMSPGLAESALANPRLTTVIVTLLGTLNRILATFLFGCAVIVYGQERATTKDKPPLTVFAVSALLAFRHMSLMWSIGEWWALFKRVQRLAVIALLFLCLAGLALIPSGTAGLLAPVRFNRTSALTGSEVDFTSNDTDCVTWQRDTFPRLRRDCHWMTSSEEHYQSYPCLLHSPLSDGLSAGWKNMVANIDRNDTFPQQPMANEPVRFLGPLRGILPIGPDGFRGFKTLAGWSSDSPTKLGYSYTLVQQGLESEIKCSLDHSSPIRYEDVAPWIISVDAPCDSSNGLKQVLLLDENIRSYYMLGLNNVLTYWACGSNESSPARGSDAMAYILYLRGRNKYAESVGNITCTLSKFRSQDYAVTYTGSDGYFTAGDVTASSESGRYTAEGFLDSLIGAFGDLISGTQSWYSHSVAESVLSAGERFLNLSKSEPSDGRTRLFEEMIQGALEYYALYARLLVSSEPILQTVPASCMRSVKGNLTYEVLGWYPATGNAQIWLLIPMTLINLASLAVCVAAMRIGQFGYRCDFEPMDTRSLLIARVVGKDEKVDWEDRVKF